MSAIPTLLVESDHQGIRIRFESGAGRTADPLLQQLIVPIARSTLNELCLRAGSLLRAAAEGRSLDELENVGSLLYRTLIPLRMRDTLRLLHGPLLISTDLPDVPWELLHDGEAFWGVKYALGRRLITEHAFRVVPERWRHERVRVLLVGSDPYNDLPNVALETERLYALLSRVADVVCLSGAMATTAAVAGRLADGFDVIHFSGHIVDDSAGPALVLAGGQRLSTGVMQANLTGRPLVFLNGCGSARAQPTRGTPNWSRLLASVADSFLCGGATAVIGVGCDVSDVMAPDVAAIFYTEVLRGVSIGEALRLARRGSRGSRGSGDGGSAARLAFVLYGDPQLSIASTPTAIRSTGIQSDVRRLPTTAGDSTSVRPRLTSNWPPADAPALRTGIPRPAVFAAVFFAALLVGREIRNWITPPPPMALRINDITAKGYGQALSLLERSTFFGITTLLSDVAARYPDKLEVFVTPGGTSQQTNPLGDSYGLQGTLLVRGDNAELGVHLTAANGRLVLAKAFPGKTERLIAMQNDAALAVVRSMGIRISPSEEEEILADRGDAIEESFMLLAASLPKLEGLLGESAPWSGPMDANSPEVQELLRTVAQGLQNDDRRALESVGLRLSDQEWASHVAYRQNAKDLRVQLAGATLGRRGGYNTLSFTRQDEFSGTQGSRKLRVHVSMLLENGGEGVRVRSGVPPVPPSPALAAGIPGPPPIPNKRRPPGRKRAYEPAPVTTTTTSTTLPTIPFAPPLFPNWERRTRWRNAQLLFRVTLYERSDPQEEAEVRRNELVTVAIRRGLGTEYLRACCTPLSSCAARPKWGNEQWALCLGFERPYPAPKRLMGRWWELKVGPDGLVLRVSRSVPHARMQGIRWKIFSLPWEAASWSENDWVIDTFQPAQFNGMPMSLARLEAADPAMRGLFSEGLDVWMAHRGALPTAIRHDHTFAFGNFTNLGAYTLPSTFTVTPPATQADALVAIVTLEKAVFDRGVADGQLMPPYAENGMATGLADDSLGPNLQLRTVEEGDFDTTIGGMLTPAPSPVPPRPPDPFELRRQMIQRHQMSRPQQPN